MAISFYDMSVGTYLQTLGAMNGFLEKGRAHCEANGIDLKEVVETRLYPDMNPFRFQVFAAVHMTLGALKGLEAGRFSAARAACRSSTTPASSSSSRIPETTSRRSHARAWTRSRKTQVTFQVGDFKMLFTAANFVLSFSLPNLFFHATTAYDMLRMKGAPLGKIDFLGQLRIGA